MGRYFAVSPSQHQTFKNPKEILKMNAVGEGHWVVFGKPESISPFVWTGHYYGTKKLKPNQ